MKGKIPFIQAKHYRRWTRSARREPNVVCIHSMEAPEKGATAENVAKYFQTTTRPASAHFCFDSNSVVQCVQCNDIAFGVPGFNSPSVHLELAGYARQTIEEWTDKFSLDMLEIVADVCRTIIIPKYGIQPRWLTDAEILQIDKGAEITGFCTHADCTRALKIPGGHSDPGKHFPRALLLDFIQRQ